MMAAGDDTERNSTLSVMVSLELPSHLAQYVSVFLRQNLTSKQVYMSSRQIISGSLKTDNIV